MPPLRTVMRAEVALSVVEPSVGSAGGAVPGFRLIRFPHAALQTGRARFRASGFPRARESIECQSILQLVQKQTLVELHSSEAPDGT